MQFDKFSNILSLQPTVEGTFQIQLNLKDEDNLSKIE